MNARATAANVTWLASSIPAWIKFQRALNDPETAQRRLLTRLLRANENSDYGRRHDFGAIRNVEEFRASVPMTTWDDLAPWIDRVAQGENNVLTAERVTHLMPTSGSTGARKLIPLTAGLQAQFNRAIAAWITDLARLHPSIAAGTAYWSVTPALAPQSSAATSVPIGFESDSAYLGGGRSWLVDATMAVPSEVGQISDLVSFRYVVLLSLLRAADLRVISIWHPSFLLLLLDALPAVWRDVLMDIETGTCRVRDGIPDRLQSPLRRFRPDPRRAAQLRRAGPHDIAAIWPALRVVSCWADAASELPCNALQARLGRIAVQPKGLLSTEGVVSIPFRGTHPLAVESHFFEFVDAVGKVVDVTHVQVGESYEIVLTTAGGLWRYRTGDMVTVTGYLQRTPTLRFASRVGAVSDLCGEKLAEPFVEAALKRIVAATSRHPTFAMLAPDADAPQAPAYTVYVEGDLDPQSVLQLDAELAENPQYAYCRRIGQLGPVCGFRIEHDAYATFVAVESAAGSRVGDIKPRALSARTDWTRRFKGKYVTERETYAELRRAGEL